MIRKAIAIVALAIASPALANTMPIVDGALTVHTGDTLVTSKPLVETDTAGVLTERLSGGWVNRMDGGRFTLSGGATKLKVLGSASGGYVANGYTYEVVDGTPAAAALPAVTAQVAAASAPSTAPSGPLYGINLSGGEFANQGSGQLLPTPADIDAYHAVGYNLFRVPFKTTEIAATPAKLTALAAECTKLNVPCIFDRHEYAWPAVADQVAFWVQATKLLGPAAQIDLENEPSGFTASDSFDQWATDSQAIVTGLRAAGVKNRIWLEWPGSSGTQRFDKGKRAPATCDSAACSLAKLPGGTINDPLHLTGLEGHRYFDTNGSGTSSTCASYVILASMARQAVPFRMPVLFGEVAFGSDVKISPTCTALAPSIMAEIKASPNLYGVTVWGGGAKSGSIWGSYMFRAEPNAASAYVQMTTGH